MDILAAALDLPDADRAVLRGWYERHAAFYRIESLNVRGSQVETLDAVNLINDQTYRVRVELKRKTCVFQAGQMVYGSLVPWHDEWYWSGTQKTWENPPRDFSSVKRVLPGSSAASAGIRRGAFRGFRAISRLRSRPFS